MCSGKFEAKRDNCMGTAYKAVSLKIISRDTVIDQISEAAGFEAQFAGAQAAEVAASLTEPRAIAAYYDEKAALIVICLKSGAAFSFPPNIAQGLAGAEAADLAKVEVTPAGDGLHWEVLDADFTVKGLLSGIFGSKRWMAELQERWHQEAS